MPTALHRARLDTIVDELLSAGATSILDLGCGTGELLQRLKGHVQFERLVGIDIDEQAIAKARRALDLDPLMPVGHLQVRYGSFEVPERELAGFDAAVMLETIEHIDPGRLSRVERAVFAGLSPSLILITTPNQEYNVVHGMDPWQRRHPGHRFEWNRTQFRMWSSGVGERNGYDVTFVDIGPIDPVHGSSTQMARFSKQAADEIEAAAFTG